MDRGTQVMGVVQCNRLGQAKSLCLITCKVLMTSSLMRALAKNQSPAESCLLLSSVFLQRKLGNSLHGCLFQTSCHKNVKLRQVQGT